MLLREFCLFWNEERFIMRKILSFLVASVLVVGVILFVPSCIKEEYSLKNLDTTVTILPGLSVPLHRSSSGHRCMVSTILNWCSRLQVALWTRW